MPVFLAELMNLGERFFVIRRRDGQPPAGRLVLLNDVFDSLAGEDQAPIHRLASVADGNQGVEGVQLHGRMLYRERTVRKRVKFNYGTECRPECRLEKSAAASNS